MSIISVRKEFLFMIAVGVVVIYYAAKFIRSKRNKGYRIGRKDHLRIGIFLYFIALTGVTLFPIVIPPASVPYQMEFVNWDITDMLNYGSWSSLLSNVGGNILMFVPLLPLIELKIFPKRISLVTAFFISLGVSATIEGLQYLENIFAISDFPIRMTDISDLILNCIGGIIGHFIFLFRNSIAGRDV